MIRAFVFVISLAVITGCARLARPMDPDPLPCPKPDAQGMSARLADRFHRLSQDTSGRAGMRDQKIDPDQVTVPVVVTDMKLCGRIAASFGVPKEGAAEGGTFYTSGPYLVFAPWRDYSRRAEWINKNEFVGLIVLDRNMQVLGAFAM